MLLITICLQEGKIVIWTLTYLSRSLCCVDCNNKQSLPFSWFFLLLISLLKLFAQTWYYSVFLFNLFYRFWCWLFVAAKVHYSTSYFASIHLYESFMMFLHTLFLNFTAFLDTWIAFPVLFNTHVLNWIICTIICIYDWEFEAFASFEFSGFFFVCLYV